MLQLPMLLTLSMLALVFGAGMGLLLKNRGWGIAALKGLMASFLGGLLVLHLLPHAYERVGAISLLAILAGFVFVVLIERISMHKAHKHEHGEERFFTAEMLWVGLILHQVTDGIGLGIAADGVVGDWRMAMAVIVHRIPVAAVVVWLFQRRGEMKEAWLRVLGMGLATIAGALFSSVLGPIVDTAIVDLFYAFIAGSFLHLLTHDFLDHHAHILRDRRSEFLAFVFGIGLLILAEKFFPDPHALEAVAHGHDHAAHAHENSGFFTALLILVRETAPYLVLGLVTSGLLHAYLPQSPITWLSHGRPLKQSLKGMAFGLPLPICSCGVLPLFLSLAKKGVPPACLVAFLIATPELGVDSFLLSVKLLGVKFSMVRLAVAMVLPVIIALIAVKFLPKSPVVEEEKSCCGGHKEKPKAWWRFAFVDLVDDIFPFIFFGLVIAALAEVLWPSSEFQQFVGQWDVLVLGALGIPFYVCASASVPFALILLQHGFSVGAVVVFLFAGPATNVATILTVNKAFGEKAGLKLAATAFIIAVITGFTINASFDPGDLDVFELHDHGWSLINGVSTGILALAGVFSLYRSGPLHWISIVVGMIPGVIHHPKANSEDAGH